MTVRWLAPAKASGPLTEADLPTRTLPPFHEIRVEGLAALSRILFNERAVVTSAAASAVAFWMRAANVRRMRDNYSRQNADGSWLGVAVGRVFHVTPANVDTMFIYSWALAFLCGNASVVRLSTRQSPLVEVLIDCLNRWMAADDEFRQSTAFVTYEHDVALTSRLSQWCTHRIVWGGDAAVAAIRPVPLPFHASERVFGTKFSYSAIASRAVIEAAAEDRAALAQAFNSDVFNFDQAACSSSRIVFWIGSDDDARQAIPIFNAALRAAVEERGHQTTDGIALERLAFGFEQSAGGGVKVDLALPAFISAQVDSVERLRRDAAAGGYLQYVSVPTVDAVAAFSLPGDQTITHFGLPREQVHRLAMRAGERGVDRVVPIGEALAFEAIWDGYSLVDDLVRRVVVRMRGESR